MNQLDRRRFLGLSAAALAACSSPAPEPDAEAKRPNVLFLFPDQMRAQAMGCSGNLDVKTPHLDQLAADGLLLRNTFANTPVCCPARANILTGKYAHSNGMIANDLRLRETETTVAEIFSDAGYRTGFIGKWHLDGGPRLPGFVPPGERRQGFEHWAANQCSHKHFGNHYFRDSDNAIPLDKFESEGWSDLAVEFLEESTQDDRPFFLTVQMGPPHNPYKAPQSYEAMYDPDQIKLRPNWQDGERVPGREAIASYYAMVTAVDDQIGRIRATLAELDLTDDTIVFVSSDHGDMLGSQGMRLKRKPWEESIQVPGIFYWPGKIDSGRVSDEIFTHVDFAPTFLGLCGLDAPAEMQGQDLSTVLLDESAEGPDSAFFQIFGPYLSGGVTEGWRGVRTKRYMYARYEDRPWVLYDLEEDPYQLNNLANAPEAKAVRDEMDAKLTEWMGRTGDSWDANWEHPVEDAGRLYKFETFYQVDEYLAWAAANPDKAP